MPDKSAFVTFLIASCLLNLAPGPATRPQTWMSA